MTWIAPIAWSGEKSVMAVSVRPIADQFKSSDLALDKLALCRLKRLRAAR
jgi:hypothetical protein